MEEEPKPVLRVRLAENGIWLLILNAAIMEIETHALAPYIWLTAEDALKTGLYLAQLAIDAGATPPDED